MPIYPFLQIDVFSDHPLGGNPCAVLMDTEDLDEAAMLAIARENNLSETAFLRSSDTATAAARFFTPASEIPFAGHPTIAAVYALFDSGRTVLAGEVTRISLELIVGTIPIDVYAQNGIIQRIVMTQMRPEFLRIYSAAEIVPVFNLEEDDLLPGACLQTVSTGTPYLMLPLKDHKALRKARLDIPRYIELRNRSDFFSPHLFCLDGISIDASTFARNLDVPPDLPEDPFTGSATGCMAAYLWRYGQIESPEFIAEQGHWIQRPGRAWVEVIGQPDDIQAVKVSGNAVTVVRGSFHL